ncbi:NAD(P)/FAD-dependent oxidoreductase [Euzebya rosea]|uniref:NAD(P)/FAD-dependent oxidoreductase n=1 Tax=Euzebya rosea TaxID=2052804 RepID=UPI000D3E1F8A|nr:FAD-dependent oxidoreductase [Euzebya rosea]
MTATETHIIVGAGLAGATAARTLREHGFDGRVVLVGDERHLPYERPQLSKQYLRGEVAVEDTLVLDAQGWTDVDVDVVLDSAVTWIDIADRRIVLGNGRSRSWDRLLLATGAEPRALPVRGSDLAGVHVLRRIADAERLQGALRRAERLVVVGGGWLGSEVAASARQMGVEVALVEQGSVPLGRTLGERVGAVYRDLHASHGVVLHTHATVAAVLGDRRVTAVQLADGTVLSADVVVVGVGVRPRAQLAARAGLRVGDGIEVDARLETSVPGIFAAGDVAAAWHPRLDRRIRVEHWANAMNQGTVAAVNMLGGDTQYDRMPYFFSDQYELGMELVGLPDPSMEVVFRGDPSDGRFMAFWLADGRVGAAMNANIWDVQDTLRGLVESGRTIDRARLMDPGEALDALVAS